VEVVEQVVLENSGMHFSTNNSPLGSSNRFTSISYKVIQLQLAEVDTGSHADQLRKCWWKWFKFNFFKYNYICWWWKRWWCRAYLNTRFWQVVQVVEQEMIVCTGGSGNTPPVSPPQGNPGGASNASGGSGGSGIVIIRYKYQ
jgi:hypothetical protein